MHEGKAVATWDSEYDVVVVGSGAGGLAAAITAHVEGLNVLVVEKTDRVGGSTAISGGAIWIPLAAQSRAVAPADSPERVREYLGQFVGSDVSEGTLAAFLAAGPRMVDYLGKHASLTLAPRPYSPDYYSGLNGAAPGGRALDPVEFDGRTLGKNFRLLRDPLREFMVLGGMMVALPDVRHLLRVTRSFTSWRIGMKLVMRYFADRLRGYHRGTRLLLGNALAARLYKSVLDRNIACWLSSPATALHHDGTRVCGITVRRNGVEQHIAARKGVVLATGGFPGDPVLREALFPKPAGAWSMAPPDNTGDGIRLGQTAGAVLGKDHLTAAFWAPVSVLQRPDGSHLNYPHLVWDRAKPGLIAVNGAGQRFVNEANSYHEFVLGMYRSHERVPTIPAFLICDHAFIETWGLGLALPGGRPRQHLIDAGYLLTAPTLGALAEVLGIDAAALETTVARCNAFAIQGEDPDFGKGGSAYNRHLGDAGHEPNACLGQIARPPFYAVKVYPGDIGTACGMRVDAHARAIDAAGVPIPGLYVAGNDMDSVLRGHYPGPGITLGPALTFGWLAGMHLAESSTECASVSATSHYHQSESLNNPDYRII